MSAFGQGEQPSPSVWQGPCSVPWAELPSGDMGMLQGACPLVGGITAARTGQKCCADEV